MQPLHVIPLSRSRWQSLVVLLQLVGAQHVSACRNLCEISRCHSNALHVRVFPVIHECSYERRGLVHHCPWVHR
jgi:hypothetical protein